MEKVPKFVCFDLEGLDSFFKDTQNPPLIIPRYQPTHLPSHLTINTSAGLFDILSGPEDLPACCQNHFTSLLTQTTSGVFENISMIFEKRSQELFMREQATPEAWKIRGHAHKCILPVKQEKKCSRLITAIVKRM